MAVRGWVRVVGIIRMVVWERVVMSVAVMLERGVGFKWIGALCWGHGKLWPR